MEERFIEFLSRAVGLSKNYFSSNPPSNAARIVLLRIIKRAFGAFSLMSIYQRIYAYSIYLDRYAISIDWKFIKFPQNQILNEIKYPYICNYGYHIYPKYFLYLKNEFLFKAALLTNNKKNYATKIELQEGHMVPEEESLVSDLLESLSFIQRNTIYGCGIDSYPKESIPQIKPEKPSSEIYAELTASRRRMINQKFLKEADINADDK